ncbi:NADH-ubiquinone oxidoreductase chain L [hydrothermal vent metagenome]|uniref:NADH-ubiquinone oxidoreductase chain L n=1 Tax=hydrothermal vent metagenome TaxID=652676 RepID=A0A3B0U2A2_9ZZZZ
MNLIAFILLAPLLAALLIFALRRAPEIIALVGIAISFLAALGLLANAFNGGAATEIILPGLPDMPLRLLASPLTSVFSALVATVASFVLLYAVGYMRKDPEKVRFFATMLLFVTAMQALVLAGDWITLLAAWELIGFSSYLLIGFWYARAGVASAATRAFIYTRTADLGLYIAVFVLIGAAGTSEISATLTTTGTPALIAGLLLLVAAIGKSAQMPLQDWLQRAMAGPTPVSALLHSATLVAAGAILLIRIAPMLPSGALLAVGIVGGLTAVITGLVALGERDLKRLLASSTSSQYGLMLVAVGAGAPIAALLHLIAHAAIKSSLFLGAGVFQHDRESTALEKLSGAGRTRPLIFAGFVVSALALAGIPPLVGFFSKDAIIAASLSGSGALWLAPLALAGTLLTGAYMARALNVLWVGKPRSITKAGGFWMGAGIAALVVLVIVLGAGFPALENLLDAELTTSTLAVVLGLSAATSGLLLGWFVPNKKLLGPILPWAQRNFAVAGGFDGLVLAPALAIANACEKLERRLYDGVLAIGRINLTLGRFSRKSDEDGIDAMIFGLVRVTIATGGRARLLQSGFIHRELALTIIGTALIAALLILAPLYF